MLALAKCGRSAFVALAMLARWIAAKLSSAQKVWVTGRTGNATVITDRVF
jgi:hypothetical protein